MAVAKRHLKKPKASKDAGGSKSKPMDESTNLGGPHVWKGYDLNQLGVPKQAWPSPSKDNKGSHGYTVSSDTNNAVTLIDLDPDAFSMSIGDNP